MKFFFIALVVGMVLSASCIETSRQQNNDSVNQPDSNNTPDLPMGHDQGVEPDTKEDGPETVETCLKDGDCVQDVCLITVCKNNSCHYEEVVDCCHDAGECDDGDLCTQDRCQDNRCENKEITGCCETQSDCEDGNPCTDNLCLEQQCYFAPVDGCCLTHDDCQGDESDLCAVYYCNDYFRCDHHDKCPFGCEPTGECVIPECETHADCKGTGCSCQGGNLVCTELLPHCVDGVCDYMEETNTCHYGCNPISLSCKQPECHNDQDCESGPVCTLTVCDQGWCVNQPVPDCCVSKAQCSDDDPCTIDQCIENSCSWEPLCSEGEVCNDNGECVIGQCFKNYDCPVSQVCECQDGIQQCEVTLAVCLPDLTCQKQTEQAVCQYGCDGDVCAVAECLSDIECDDGDPCTVNTCLEAKCGMEQISGCCNSDAGCEDGDLCTEDICFESECFHKAKCPFGCEMGVCDEPTCEVNADCDDDDPCSLDLCVAGSCYNDPLDSCCTADFECNNAPACFVGKCLSNNTCSYTQDETCCTWDGECDDDNPCTLDACVDSVCTHEVQEVCCTKNSDCHSTDKCQAGLCIEGACYFAEIEGCCYIESDCDDGDWCTVDRCLSNKCYHNEDMCGVNECDSQQKKCLPSSCQVSSDCAVVFENTACNGFKKVQVTIDSVCDVGAGYCLYYSQETDCPGGCHNGECLPVCQSSMDCDDGNPCTTDSCMYGDFCQHTPIPGCQG